MQTCPEICEFKTFGGWCGLSACIRRNTTTQIKANPVVVIPKDYVRVVRCRECQFGVLTKNGLGEDIVICENPDSPALEQIAVMPDWYCADGERRDDDALSGR